MDFNKIYNVVKYRSFKCIGLLIFCITFLLSLNLYSNASAITFTENLTKVNTLSTGNWKCYWKRSDSSTLIELSNPCTIPALNGADAAAITRQVTYFENDKNIEFKKGHIYEVKIYTRITQSSTAIDYPIPVIWSVSSSGAPQNLRLRQVDINYEGLGTANSVTTFNNTPVTYQYYPQQSVVYSIFFEADNDSTAHFKIGRADSGQFFNLPPTPSSSLFAPAFQIVVNAGIFEYVSGSASDEAAEKEMEGTTNIENQSTSDVSNPTNNQTTSLVGTISSFVSAFSYISPAANCNLTLPFPDFLGGDTTVDICTGADKAPTLIAAGSSLLLIITFIPLAFIMLRMIYNEIRSFTNG